jgi:hypothetical protein
MAPARTEETKDNALQKRALYFGELLSLKKLKPIR